MLRVTYQNFGQVPDFSCTLDPGVTLLKGESGHGKSTTYKALVFGLYGEIGVKPPPDRPGVVVLVEVPHRQLTIRRQKKSDRLQVRYGERYAEDAEGQALIDYVVGSFDHFMISSYIPQESYNIFFTASTNDRLGLMERALGNDIPVDTWLTQLSTQKAQLTGQFDAITAAKTRHVAQAPIVPVGAFSNVNTTPEAIVALEAEIATLEQTVRVEETALTVETERAAVHRRLTADLAALGVVVTTTPPTDDDLSTRQVAILAELDTVASATKRQELETALSALSVTEPIPVETLTAQRTAHQLYTAAHTALTRAQALPNAPSITPATLSQFGEWTSQIHATAAADAHAQRIARVQHQLAQYAQPGGPGTSTETTDDIMATVADRVQPCPQCGVRLSVTATTLTLVTGPVLTTAEAAAAERHKQHRITQAKERIRLTTELAALQASAPAPPAVLPAPPAVLTQIIQLLTPHITALLTPPTIPLAEITRHEAWHKYQAVIALLPPRPMTTPRPRVDAEAELKEITTTAARRRIERATAARAAALQDQLRTHVTGDPERATRVATLRTTVTAAKARLHYTKATATYAAYQAAAAAYVSQLDELTKHIDAITVLIREINTAQYVYVDQLLETLNGLVNEIATKLFDEPITIRLEAFRALKTKKELKPSLHLHIGHKGYEKDTIWAFSSGERQRISLAFTLALSKILGREWLLLDEVGPALNDTLKEAMLTVLNEYGPAVTIVTQHSTVEGFYQNTIDLDAPRQPVTIPGW